MLNNYMLYMFDPHPADLNPFFVMVAFHTCSWITESLPKFREAFPQIPFLIIDNNPALTDPPKRRDSFQLSSYLVSAKWTPQCEAERVWLLTQDVAVITTPRYSSHGHCIDLAVNWGIINGYNTMIHIEPDCSTYGPNWLNNLFQAIRDGYWMATGFTVPHGELHPTPSIWRLDIVRYMNLSFDYRTRDPLQQERRFYELINIGKLLGTDWSGFWDTGLLASYRCARKKRALVVSCKDFAHHFHGSMRKRPGVGFLHGVKIL